MNGKCSVSPAADQHLDNAYQDPNYGADPFNETKLFGHDLVEEFLEFVRRKGGYFFCYDGF